MSKGRGMGMGGLGMGGAVLGMATMMLNSAMEQQQLEKEKREREEEMRATREKVQQRLSEIEQLRLQEEREEKEKRKRKHPVVVIGCGASGIAALTSLQRAGVPAVGVEASDRIGGRIFSTALGTKIIDIGAAWCHGEVNNKVFELANPLGLLGRPEPTDNDDDKDWYVLSDGSLMPTGNAEAILEAINEAIQTNNKNSETSIVKFVRTSVEAGDIRTAPAQVPITEPFLEWYERENNLGSNGSTAAKSLKALQKQEICEGEFWLNWKGRGYKTILDVMMGVGTNPLPLDIKYNKPVKEICWQIPNPDPNDQKPTILIRFSDGTSMKACRAIITVPLGVLKQNYDTMFTPSLPQAKINAINNLQYCVLDKIYIEFEKPWWPKGLTSFKLLWQEADKRLFQRENWVTGIYGLRTVEHLPNVLLAWIYGPHAEEMERVSEGHVLAGINKLLDHVFSLNFNVTKIKNFKRSKWASNPYARGSYSYRGESTEAGGAGAEALGEPLPSAAEPVLCFAGEATSHRWHGHVHGAIDAGYREAERVISAARPSASS